MLIRLSNCASPFLVIGATVMAVIIDWKLALIFSWQHTAGRRYFIFYYEPLGSLLPHHSAEAGIRISL